MAVEFDRQLTDALQKLPKNHPDTKHLRTMQRINKGYIEKDEDGVEYSVAGELIHEFIRELPDETKVVEFIPHLYDLDLNPNHREWRRIYESLPQSERVVMTLVGLRILRNRELLTLGDLRSFSPSDFGRIRGLGEKSVLLAVQAFRPVETSTT